MTRRSSRRWCGADTWARKCTKWPAILLEMQFTWSGCDSALAAPLVLDLARFAALAHRAGVVGPVLELGFFFKNPVDCTEHALEAQYATLAAWARSAGAAV